MRILLFGASGQVGWELNKLINKSHEVILPNRKEADFAHPTKLINVVKQIKPDIIINAAAYTLVDKAEDNANLAQKINSDAVYELANIARKYNLWLIHYSTDYVFDGLKAIAYTETDIANPLNIYGKTKLLGDLHIENSGCKYLIFRTSWVYSSRRTNFIKKITNLLTTQGEIKVVHDQIGTPTDAALIANVTIKAINCLDDVQSNINSGVYNLSSAGKTSFYGIATYVLDRLLQQQKDYIFGKIIPVSTSELQLKALRPLNSLLNCKKLCDTFKTELPCWERGVKTTLKEYL